MIGPGPREVVEIAFRLDDHEMDIERLAGAAADRRHDRGSERDVGYEPAVHDVDMDPVRARPVDGADFLADPPEVGGENGGSYDDGRHCASG
jgi:hypothetical protein